MSLSDKKIKERIKEYIVKKYKISEKVLTYTVNLFENGIIDSMGVLDLVIFLEKTFEVKFEEEHLFDQRFRTIKGMASVIKQVKEET